jgi:L-fucose isomerase-like protein
MMAKDYQGTHFRRRDFIKATTLAGMAATLPVTNILGMENSIAAKASPKGTNRNLLFIGSSTEASASLIDTIKSIKEYDFQVSVLQTNYRKPEEISDFIKGKDADVLFMRSPGAGTSSAQLAEPIGNLNIPVLLFPADPTLIMLEADLAAALREKGVNAILAHSETHAMELLRAAAAPRVLEGKKAVIFGKPFMSTSVPVPNLNADYVYQRTGVRLEYRPIDELEERIKDVDEARAKKEMERWKAEATKIVEPSDESILKASRIYVLLRDIIDDEGLSSISIDCLSFSFGGNRKIPTPCLAFTRLRDDGVSAPCEADVCMMLSSMVLQEVSRKPSYVSNVSEVNAQASRVIFRHCVAPTKFLGVDSEQLPYNLRDYHGMGRDVVPEVQFPQGVEITMGGFTKDLNSFVLWPGRIQPGANDTETRSFKNPPPGMEKMRKFCSNRAEVQIKDVNQFMQNIAGIHHIMVAGIHTRAIRDAMLRMNVNVIEPPDSAAPAV